MICELCWHWQNTDIRYKGSRGCRATGKEVTCKTSACRTHYEIPDLLWCEKTSCWLSLAECKSRQERGHEECYRCSEKKVINMLNFFRQGVSLENTETTFRRRGTRSKTTVQKTLVEPQENKTIDRRGKRSSRNSMEGNLAS